eukprot:58127_1
MSELDIDLENQDLLQHNGSTMRGIGNINLNQNEHDFLPKLITTIVILIGFPVLTSFLYMEVDMEASHIEAVLLMFVHTFYFCVLYIAMFWRSPQLYRVKARYTMIDGWAQFALPNRCDAYKTYAIKSVSEFSAVRGTFLHTALLFVGLCTFCLYFGHFLENSNYWCDTNDIISALFSFGAGCGLTWLGLWELNPNDKCHVIMHYMGVVLCFGANLGLGFATQWGWLFWSTAIPAIISAILWQYFDKTAKLPSNDIKYVHKVTIQCIISESIVLLMGCTAFDLYLWFYDITNRKEALCPNESE